MKSLVISTNSDILRIGIFDKTKKIAEISSKKELKTAQAESLKDITEKLFEQAKISLSVIDLIVVTIGPGSYTGSRSGLAFAKAISHGTGKNIVGVSSLDVLTFKSKPKAFPFLIALAAGEDRYYTKIYQTPEGLFNTREAGEIKLLNSSAPQNRLVTNEHPNLSEINEYGQLFFEMNGSDDFMKLLPSYLQEPNITQPKK